MFVLNPKVMKHCPVLIPSKIVGRKKLFVPADRQFVLAIVKGVPFVKMPSMEVAICAVAVVVFVK